MSDASDSDQPLLALLGRYGTQDRWYVGIGVVSGLVNNVLSNLDVLIIGLAFDALFNDRAYQLPLVPTEMIPSDPVGQLAFTVALLSVLKISDLGFVALEEWSWGVFAQRTVHRIRVETFDRVQRREMAFFDGSQVGETMSVLTNDVNFLERFLQHGGETLLVAVVLMGSSVVYMLVLNWQLALVTIAVVPVLALVNWRFAQDHERRQDVVRSRLGDLNATLKLTIQAIPVVKAFDGEAREHDRIKASSDAYRSSSVDAFNVTARHMPTLRVLTGLAFVATFYVGTQWAVGDAVWFLSGTITAGELVPFIYYTSAMIVPVQNFASVTSMYQKGAAAANRVLGIQAANEATDWGDDDLKDVRGRVEYEGVTFGYQNDGTAVRNVSFMVEPGDTVGVVGPSGSGKSTLVSLLPAFYEPDEGTICLDGADVGACSLGSVRDAVGYVSQEPYLFSGTIEENIAYGDSESDPGRSTVVNAAKAACAHRFVRDLPNGYDTKVGEAGTGLSGGQRQRIALARALVADTPVLVLDEATSQVDAVLRAVIWKRLRTVCKNRTVIVVAHRLATVRQADSILYLEDGEVRERGSHEELLASGGEYVNKWHAQFGSPPTSSDTPQ